MLMGSAVRDIVGTRRVEDDPRYGCFYMIHNRATVAQEILHCFSKAWNGLDASVVSGRIREEVTDRCMEITRSLFIGTMSAVEHSAKRSVNLYPGSRLHSRLEELRSRNRYIVLKGIIQESAHLGLVPDDQLAEWMDLMLLRNLAVHNNSISDTDSEVRVGDLSLTLRHGEMMRGELDTYLRLAKRSMGLYHAWICKVDQDSLFIPSP